MCWIVGMRLLVRLDLMFWVAILHWSVRDFAGLCCMLSELGAIWVRYRGFLLMVVAVRYV